MKISTLILLGFALILLLFSATTFFNYMASRQVDENSQFYAKSSETLRHSNRFQRNVLNMVSGLRAYLFTGEPSFKASYDSAVKDNEQVLDDLKRIVQGEPDQTKALEAIRELNAQWVMQFANPLIEAREASRHSDSAQLVFQRRFRQALVSADEQTLNIRLQQEFRDFTNREYNKRETRIASLTSSVSYTRKLTLYLFVISIVGAVIITLLVVRRISRRIHGMVTVADEISKGNYNVHIEHKGNDELSHLAQSLNHMAHVLGENFSLLSRKNEELSQFAHIVSHDLKAPLRGIDNVVNWIEEDHQDELSPSVKNYLHLIKGRLVRAENLINGILMYARVGRDEVRTEKVDLNDLLDEILENLSPPSGIRIDLPANLPTIQTEKIPLQQVLSNLISNAIKYHHKEKGFVRIRWSVQPDAYVFSVSDDGPGIERQYHDKIFQIFQTLHTRDSFESTGVGLAIVKKILSDRRQTIRLTSVPGKGSEFSFSWPK